MLKNVFHYWQGCKVRLRGVEPADWEGFHRNDHDSEAQRLTDVIHFPRSDEAARKWAEEMAHRRPDDDSVFLAIENREGELVGGMSTSDCDRRHGTFKYGLGIFRGHRRKGYATDAITVLLGYYFRELRFQKVTTGVYSFNEASLALHKKLGFTVEGRLRRMIFTGGRFHDLVMVGMTCEEFEERT